MMFGGWVGSLIVAFISNASVEVLRKSCLQLDSLGEN